MPEIAEVEVIRRCLAPLVGQTLHAVDVADVKLRLDAGDVAGVRCQGVLRHGKLLGLRFGDQVLAVHLRMTGALLFAERPDARAVLRFDDRALSFVDPRQFGTLTVGAVADFAAGAPVDLLAASDEQIADAARRACRGRRAVKAVLLDQRAVTCGIGNYIADEAVGSVPGVHPAARACDVDVEQWERLLRAARGVAQMALKLGGVSMRDYVHPDGSRGSMQRHLAVYGRVGQPCRRCATPLVKTVVAGRGTTFCPGCAAT